MLLNTAFTRPFCDSLYLSTAGEAAIASSIVRLNDCDSPSAILRRIWPIIVPAIKCMFGWWIAHIGIEILKGCPSRADLDSSSTVSRISYIAAPVYHAVPLFINPSFRHAVLKSKTILKFLEACAPATLGIATSKVIAIYNCLVSAIALALPISPSPFISTIVAKNKQHAEAFSRHLDYFAHAAILADYVRYVVTI